MEMYLSFLTHPPLKRTICRMAEYTLCWHTEIASSGFCFFAVVDFYLFIYFLSTLLHFSLPLSYSYFFPPFLPFSICFVFLLKVRSLNLEIKKKFVGGTITSVPQSKTLVCFELNLWKISIIHISKSTLICHSGPDPSVLSIIKLVAEIVVLTCNCKCLCVPITQRRCFEVLLGQFEDSSVACLLILQSCLSNF